MKNKLIQVKKSQVIKFSKKLNTTNLSALRSGNISVRAKEKGVDGFYITPSGMKYASLKTKDIVGYMKPLLSRSTNLYGVSIPGEAATMTAEETVKIARDVGFEAVISEDVESAIRDIIKQDDKARILICGSLYLAGNILQKNS